MTVLKLSVEGIKTLQSYIFLQYRPNYLTGKITETGEYGCNPAPFPLRFPHGNSPCGFITRPFATANCGIYES